jgi:hypothetical protein
LSKHTNKSNIYTHTCNTLISARAASRYFGMARTYNR